MRALWGMLHYLILQMRKLRHNVVEQILRYIQDLNSGIVAPESMFLISLLHYLFNSKTDVITSVQMNIMSKQYEVLYYEVLYTVWKRLFNVFLMNFLKPSTLQIPSSFFIVCHYDFHTKCHESTKWRRSLMVPPQCSFLKPG